MYRTSPPPPFNSKKINFRGHKLTRNKAQTTNLDPGELALLSKNEGSILHAWWNHSLRIFFICDPIVRPSHSRVPAVGHDPSWQSSDVFRLQCAQPPRRFLRRHTFFGSDLSKKVSPPLGLSMASIYAARPPAEGGMILAKSEKQNIQHAHQF